MCHLNILFVEMFSCLLPISNLLSLLLLSFESSLYVLDTHLFLDCGLQIFSPIFLAYFFVFFIMVFLRAKVFDFDEIQLIKFFLMNCVSGVKE